MPSRALPRAQGSDGGVESLGFGMLGGGVLVGLWMAVLIAVLVLARTLYKDGDGPLNWFEVFYRIGSIIYGGGQVRGRVALTSYFGPCGRDCFDTVLLVHLYSVANAVSSEVQRRGVYAPTHIVANLA